MNTRIPPDPDLIQRTWPRTETPMARLLTLGPQALSDAEVLAVLLRKGEPAKSARELAQEVLTQAGSISALLGRPGTLDVEAQARISAAYELVRRALKEEISSRDALSSPQAVRNFLRTALAGREHEVFVLLALDSQHRVIACDELFRGTLSQTSVYPREVVKCALKYNAAAVIFGHNHPSGVAEPSPADEILTRSLKTALALVDIQVLDHFIVAGSSSMSFAERGLL